ncbi:MAG: helix-turn-helix transcriptional regulator [Culicoidibacterales bacterium]
MHSTQVVKSYRSLMGMTQLQMAQELGCSLQSYNQKELGKNNFTDKEKLVFRELVKTRKPDITIDDIFFTK